MNYNVIVIGFGKGGKTLAMKLAKQQKKVALIEKSPKMYGGTCVNIGCIPSKRLVFDAKKAPKADFQTQELYYQQSINEKKAFIKLLNNANYQKISQAGVEIIDGVASFKDEHTITVLKADGSSYDITGDTIIINTGAKSFIPDIEGIKDNPYVLDSTAILDLEKLPKTLSIIGGGYIALEFAFAFANYGTKVSIIQDNEVFLAKEDNDVADKIYQLASDKKIEIITGAKINKLINHQIFYTKDDNNLILEAEKILIATGRVPNIDDLQLENAGIKKDERNLIITDKHLKTNIPHIFAIGDVANKLQFTYISLDDYRIVYDVLVNQGLRTKENRGSLAYTLFIEPELSIVGLNEKQAQSLNKNYRVLKMDTSMIVNAKVIKDVRGFLKVIVDNDTDKILGAAFLCTNSQEIINIVKLAIDQNLDYRVLRDFMYTHPSISEAMNELFD